ncbi:hypothetical protein ACFW2D_13880 [Streptomyces sp. NPDC058914]
MRADDVLRIAGRRLLATARVVTEPAAHAVDRRRLPANQASKQ